MKIETVRTLRVISFAISCGFELAIIMWLLGAIGAEFDPAWLGLSIIEACVVGAAIVAQCIPKVQVGVSFSLTTIALVLEIAGRIYIGQTWVSAGYTVADTTTNLIPLLNIFTSGLTPGRSMLETATYVFGEAMTVLAVVGLILQLIVTATRKKPIVSEAHVQTTTNSGATPPKVFCGNCGVGQELNKFCNACGSPLVLASS